MRNGPGQSEAFGCERADVVSPSFGIDLALVFFRLSGAQEQRASFRGQYATDSVFCLWPKSSCVKFAGQSRGEPRFPVRVPVALEGLP